MVIFVTPKRRTWPWSGKIQVMVCRPEEAFEVFQRMNEDFESIRDEIDVTLQHITEEQIPDWIYNNIEPTWWEILLGRIRYHLWTQR